MTTRTKTNYIPLKYPIIFCIYLHVDSVPKIIGNFKRENRINIVDGINIIFIQ